MKRATHLSAFCKTRAISLGKDFVGLVLLVCASSYASALTIEVTQEELQNKVAAMTPLELRRLGVTAILRNPNLELLGERKQISVLADIDLIVPGGIKYSGSAKINGKLQYKPSTNSFFMNEIDLEEINIEKLPEKYYFLAHSVLQTMATRVFASYPVYTIKGESIRNSLIKSFLKSVAIEHKKLVLSFEVFS